MENKLTNLRDELKEGPYAFPFVVPDAELMCPGMTLRDYFAAHAPITLDDAMLSLEQSNAPSCTIVETMAYLAKLRTDYADAMLAARETA